MRYMFHFIQFKLFVFNRFLKYETLTPADVPCYTYNVMIDIVVDAYKGSITRDKCEILMRRGMSPTKKAPDTYHFARDPRLKVCTRSCFHLFLVYNMSHTKAYLTLFKVADNLTVFVGLIKIIETSLFIPIFLFCFFFLVINLQVKL